MEKKLCIKKRTKLYTSSGNDICKNFGSLFLVVIRSHAFSTYTKFSQKLTLTCAYINHIIIVIKVTVDVIIIVNDFIYNSVSNIINDINSKLRFQK